MQEHEILRQGLDPLQDSNPNTGKTVGVKKQYLREARDGMLALDPVGTPALLKALDKYLQEYDSSEQEFITLEEYLPYRIPNAGYRYAMSHFLPPRDTIDTISSAGSVVISRVGR